MGGYLRTAYGGDYVALGLAFGRGSFSAVGQSGTTFLSLGTFTSNMFPKSSATFDPARESVYFYPTRFPADFDVLVYIATGSASQRLPFNY